MGRLALGMMALASASGMRASGASVAFPGSIVPLPAPGRIPANGPALARSTLLSSELAASLDVAIALRMRNFPELQARLAACDRIAPSEMTARYYPLQADYDAVVAWATSQGLAASRADPSRLMVVASGTVGTLAKAFAVSMGRVSFDNAEYTSALTAPSLPDTLASSVLAINGLQTHLFARKHLLVTPMAPNSLSGNGPPFLPSQIAHAYQADTTGRTGSGQAIAIVIDTFPLTSDLTSFWSACGVPQSLGDVQFIQVVGGTLPAPTGEETLDVEWSSSVAPFSDIRVYATKDLSFTHIDEAYMRVFDDLATQPQLHLMSLSFGAGETYVSQDQVQTDAQLFANLAAAGVTVLVSTGDGGSNPGPTGAVDGGPTQASTPSTDADVTAVGGTSVTVDATTGDVTSEVVWPDTGGGLSIYVNRPSWQVGTSVPAGSMRGVPDVAMPADPNTGGFLILNGKTFIVGGTSWSAPTWAGFAALIDQARAANGLGPMGILGPLAYPLLGSGSLRDITSGSNGAFSAGPGYDLCTGIGVPDVSALLAALTIPVPVLTSEPGNASVAAGENAVFSVTAAASGPIVYQWQISIDGGATWANLAEGSPYSGTSTNTLEVSDPSESLQGAEFRCLATDGGGTATSSPATLAILAATSEPATPPWALVVLAALLGGAGILATSRRWRVPYTGDKT